MTYIEVICHRLLGNARPGRPTAVEGYALRVLAATHPDAVVEKDSQFGEGHERRLARVILSQARAKEALANALN